LPQVRTDQPGHDVTRRRYLYRVSSVSCRRREKLTRCSGILNAAGTSEDAGTVQEGIGLYGFLVSLQVCVSVGLVVGGRYDGILTRYCTKAAGMFFLSKRTLTQHGPISAKASLTASVRSSPLRVRSRLSKRSVKNIVHRDRWPTLLQRCMLMERRLPGRSLRSPRFL
jgi:hypothetical protein